ncbi:MAG: hypothetical protein ACOX6E_05250 [Syntrophomonadaceae bacterium]|jgi:hypothetical protein
MVSKRNKKQQSEHLKYEVSQEFGLGAKSKYKQEQKKYKKS